MSSWSERLSYLKIDPDFDGTQILKNFYTTGRWSMNVKINTNLEIKDLSDFSSTEEVVEFLKGKKSDTNPGTP
ncbi:MAG TPA: hypothetical protein VKC54_01155 [Patescibacteria group bacterium]|nr:hypothetical protein [Patescibacteria group bacterium]